MQIIRDVKDNEKACRICKKFNIYYSCWKNIKNYGEHCENFNRNNSIKKVVNFKDE